MGAAFRGDNETVQYLIDHGAKMDIRDGKGMVRERYGERALLLCHRWQPSAAASGDGRVSAEAGRARSFLSMTARKPWASTTGTGT